uniref:Uncharacterized protein n=2 Tax=Opuntia streptacantha TaxID=393608 RepID=A0A7C9AHU0_OPUST
MTVQKCQTRRHDIYIYIYISDGKTSPIGRISNLECFLNQFTCFSASNLQPHTLTLLNHIITTNISFLLIPLQTTHQLHLQCAHQPLQPHLHHSSYLHLILPCKNKP